MLLSLSNSYLKKVIREKNERFHINEQDAGEKSYRHDNLLPENL